MARPLQLGFGMLALSFVRHAGAAEPALPFEVHIEGRAECAPDAFTSKLRQASQRLRPALAGEAALDFSLRVERTLGVYDGSIRVREAQGNETTRSIAGASCDEVLSALALIAVVLVDPNAVGEPRTNEGARKQGVPMPEQASPVPSPARHWRFGAGVSGGVESSVAPDVVATAAVQLETVLGGPGIFSPRLAVAVVRSAGDTVTTPAGAAHFAWTAARIDACPVRLPSSGRFALRPCLSFDAGVLDVTGEQTYRASSTRLTWLALGGVVRAEYLPVTPLTLGLDAGVVVPFVHDRFYFDPGGPAETLRVPRAGLTLRAGLSVFFE